MARRLVISGLVLLGAGLGGFAAFAHRPALAPVTPSDRAQYAPAEIARGEVLAGAGYCSNCHTIEGGAPYSGGYPITTQFGTVYSTNITPDPQTGIGAWSELAFARAMRDGVSRDGSHLFPVFPYDHFTKLSDADVHALYAYFMTRTPVIATARANTLPFPLSVRALQAGWKFLFFKPGRFVQDGGQTSEWNTGAYLAQGISHCGACHTPRNRLGAEQSASQFAGAKIENWFAPPLTGENPSPLPWDVPELVAYLRTGVSALHGTAVGPMSDVVHAGLDKLSDADIHALAVYFADVDRAASRPAAAPLVQQVLARDLGADPRREEPAARLYAVACASCHYNRGEVHPLRPELALNSALGLPDPGNLIHVILEGVSAKDGAPGVVMPGFAGLGDAEIADLANYLRTTHTGQGPWPDLPQVVAALRAAGATEH